MRLKNKLKLRKRLAHKQIKQPRNKLHNVDHLGDHQNITILYNKNYQPLSNKLSPADHQQQLSQVYQG